MRAAETAAGRKGKGLETFFRDLRISASFSSRVAIPAPRGVTGVGSLCALRLRSADARLSVEVERCKEFTLRHVLCLFIDDRAHRGGAHLLSNLNAKGADVCHLKHDAGLLGAFSIIHVPCAP